MGSIFQFLTNSPYFLKTVKRYSYSGIPCIYFWFALDEESQLALICSSPPAKMHIGWDEGSGPFKELHKTPLWFRELYCKLNDIVNHRFRLHHVTHGISEEKVNVPDLFYLTLLATDEIDFAMRHLSDENSFYVKSERMAQKVNDVFHQHHLKTKFKKITSSCFQIDVAET